MITVVAIFLEDCDAHAENSTKSEGYSPNFQGGTRGVYPSHSFSTYFFKNHFFSRISRKSLENIFFGLFFIYRGIYIGIYREV